MTDTIGTPQRAVVTVQDILHQVGRDLFDKEVASAATYSYLWIADQMGHIGLGIVVVFALGWIVPLFHLAPVWTHWLPLAIGMFLVSLWEYRAYRTYAALATGMFPSGDALLARNALIAAAYMVAGVAAGFAWHESTPIAVGVTAVAIPFLLVFAVPWLRQKIIWQKAGLPYLFRLSYSAAPIAKDDARKLQDLIDAQIAAGDKPAPKSVIILSGPLGAGKTSLACGIGTECAFGGVKVRYTSFDKLAQMAVAKSDDSGPQNINYWPWRESELLVVDDINSGVADNPYLNLDEFKAIVDGDFGPDKLCLGKRTTVWILGPKSDDGLKLWRDAIAAICEAGAGTPPAVLTIRFDAAAAAKA